MSTELWAECDGSTDNNNRDCISNPTKVTTMTKNINARWKL
jgi:hypothetical protein